MKTLREVAFERFKEKLFAKEIEPGSFLSQQELSNLLDVPVGPTREALKRLEAEGLVKLIAQRGIQIRQIDFALIQETHELRVILEQAAIEKFINTAQDSQIDQLIAQTEAMAKQLNDDNPSQDLLDEVHPVDRALHDALIESFANSSLSEIYEQNFSKIRMIRLNSKRIPVRSREVIEEHLTILRAIRDRDVTSAKEALTRHLNISYQRALGMSADPGKMA